MQYSNVQDKWKIIITDTSEPRCKQDTEQNEFLGFSEAQKPTQCQKLMLKIRRSILIFRNYCPPMESSTEV